ncbi:hypothetical protein PFISCL1PPCAC_20888, partial [Pristionchus fissidentatus]
DIRVAAVAGQQVYVLTTSRVTVSLHQCRKPCRLHVDVSEGRNPELAGSLARESLRWRQTTTYSPSSCRCVPGAE